MSLLKLSSPLILQGSIPSQSLHGPAVGWAKGPFVDGSIDIDDMVVWLSSGSHCDCDSRSGAIRRGQMDTLVSAAAAAAFASNVSICTPTLQAAPARRSCVASFAPSPAYAVLPTPRSAQSPGSVTQSCYYRHQAPGGKRQLGWAPARLAIARSRHVKRV